MNVTPHIRLQADWHAHTFAWTERSCVSVGIFDISHYSFHVVCPLYDSKYTTTIWECSNKVLWYFKREPVILIVSINLIVLKITMELPLCVCVCGCRCLTKERPSLNMARTVLWTHFPRLNKNAKKCSCGIQLSVYVCFLFVTVDMVWLVTFL